jgi:aminoglycoside phosphotransferase (APT) family kinase protein
MPPSSFTNWDRTKSTRSMSTRPSGRIDPEQSQTLAPVLLRLLRAKLGEQVGFEEAPRRLLGGNQTFVHSFRLAGTKPPWDAPLILRILRSHRDEQEVLFETIVQTMLAPLAPRVLLHDLDATLLGGAFQIMERARGRALLMGEVGQNTQGLGMFWAFASEFREAAFGGWPRLLAETHARLHALAPGPLVDALDAIGMRERLSLARRIDRIEGPAEDLGLVELRPLVAWLRESEPSLPGQRVICHGDLFPNQVFVEHGHVAGVIDWADVTLAPPEFDLGIVCAGIESVPLPGVGALQRNLAQRFRSSYERLHPVDPEAFRFGEATRIGRTMVSLALYQAGRGPAPVPYDRRGGARRLSEHLRRLRFA